MKTRSEHGNKDEEKNIKSDEKNCPVKLVIIYVTKISDDPEHIKSKVKVHPTWLVSAGTNQAENGENYEKEIKNVVNREN